MKRAKLLSAGLVLILFGAVVPSAEAGFLVGGNTRPAGSTGFGAVDGTINVAVFTQHPAFGGPGPAGDVFGTGLAGFDTFAGYTGTAFDTSANYLYLFVVSNDGVDASSISSTSAGLATAGDETSFGFWTGLGLFDAGDAAIVAAGSPLGPDGLAAFGAVNATAPLNPGPVGASVVAVAGISPTSVSANPAGPSVVASFAGSLVTAGGSSVVWGYTSKFFPVLDGGSFVDGGASGQGIIFGPLTGVTVPVPATGVLLLSLCPFVGIAVWRRTRKVA